MTTPFGSRHRRGGIDLPTPSLGTTARNDFEQFRLIYFSGTSVKQTGIKIQTVGCIRLDVASKTHAGTPTSGHHGYMAHPSLSVVVTSLHHIADALDQFKPDFVVSILSEKERSQFRAPEFGSRRVLKLGFEDSERMDNALGPTRSDIERLIAYVRDEWRGTGPLLCQCRAGAARSPAAGLIAAAVVRPSHLEFLARVARAKAYFKPNLAMLRIADDMLGMGLVDFVRRLPPSDRQDKWGPAQIAVDG